MSLWLKLFADEICCVIRAKEVVCVLPRVELSPVAGLPQYLCGQLVYQGHPVPVLDLCQLIQGRPSKVAYSSRIILVSYPHKPGQTTLLGILAERVTNAVRDESLDFTDSVLAEGKFIDGQCTTENGLMRALSVENLLDEELRESLFESHEAPH